MKQSLLLLGILLLLFTVPFVLAHGTEEEHAQEEEPKELVRVGQPNDLSIVSPFRYYSEGRWVLGTGFLIVWFFLIKGIYTLFMMLLSRLIVVDKKK